MKDKALIWQRHIEKQSCSAHTIQAYYDQQGLSSGMFYYWKRKLSRTVVSPQHSFHELEIQPLHQGGLVIDLHLGQGKLIRIEGHVSPAFLLELIQ
jgi:hypothetical protein